MVKLQTLLFIVLLLLLSACQAEEPAALPTLVSFPTATETLTPSATFTSTVTPRATDTATFTPSATNTATLTPSATWTRLPSATPTITLTFTPTATNTPEASPTALPTRTPDAPIIELFQSNLVSVSPGNPFILRWIAQADTLVLETLVNGVVTQTQNVPLIGTYSTNAPASNGQIVYRLVASRSGQEARSTITIEVGSLCTFVWFFQNPPINIGCAASLSTPTMVSFQEFERGFMFRLSINGTNRVCGVQTATGNYSCFAFQPQILVPPVTPPSGLFAPMPEVAYSFYNDLATGGFWYDQIGWGRNAGSTTNTSYQLGENGKLYVQLPNGIYAFDGGLLSLGSTYTRIN